MINAFADWLDNDPHFIGYLLGLCGLGWLVKWAFRRFRGSRGEEAGTPENRDDEPSYVRVDVSDPRAVAAVWGEYAREMSELREFEREVEGLYVIEVKQ